jgi:hypothetical protein
MVRHGLDAFARSLSWCAQKIYQYTLCGLDIGLLNFYFLLTPPLRTSLLCLDAARGVGVMDGPMENG